MARWLTDWLINSLTDRSIDWLTDRPTDQLADNLIGLAGQLTGWLTDLLDEWLADWLTDWLTNTLWAGSLVLGFVRVPWRQSCDLRAGEAGEENGAAKSEPARETWIFEFPVLADECSDLIGLKWQTLCFWQNPRPPGNYPTQINVNTIKLPEIASGNSIVRPVCVFLWRVSRSYQKFNSFHPLLPVTRTRKVFEGFHHLIDEMYGYKSFQLAT